MNKEIQSLMDKYENDKKELKRKELSKDHLNDERAKCVDLADSELFDGENKEEILKAMDKELTTIDKKIETMNLKVKSVRSDKNLRTVTMEINAVDKLIKQKELEIKKIQIELQEYYMSDDKQGKIVQDFYNRQDSAEKEMQELKSDKEKMQSFLDEIKAIQLTSKELHEINNMESDLDKTEEPVVEPQPQVQENDSSKPKAENTVANSEYYQKEMNKKEQEDDEIDWEEVMANYSGWDNSVNAKVSKTQEPKQEQKVSQEPKTATKVVAQPVNPKAETSKPKAEAKVEKLNTEKTYEIKIGRNAEITIGNHKVKVKNVYVKDGINLDGKEVKVLLEKHIDFESDDWETSINQLQKKNLLDPTVLNVVEASNLSLEEKDSIIKNYLQDCFSAVVNNEKTSGNIVYDLEDLSKTNIISRLMHKEVDNVEKFKMQAKAIASSRYGISEVKGDYKPNIISTLMSKILRQPVKAYLTTAEQQEVATKYEELKSKNELDKINDKEASAQLKSELGKIKYRELKDLAHEQEYQDVEKVVDKHKQFSESLKPDPEKVEETKIIEEALENEADKITNKEQAKDESAR